MLPNPQVTYSRDYIKGGNTAGTQTAYNFIAGWEVTSLLPSLPKRTAARANLRFVDLTLPGLNGRQPKCRGRRCTP